MADYDFVPYSDGDVDTNRSTGPSIHDLVEQRYSRRAALKSGLAMSAATVVPAAALSACDDDQPAAPPPALQVSAANAQTSAGRRVSLVGTVTGGTPTSQNWVQTSGPAVTLTNAGTANASFVAPGVAASTPLVFAFSAGVAGGGGSSAQATVTVTPVQLGFTAIAKNRDDTVTVPTGYSVTILYRLGDPINAATPAYVGDGTDTNFGARGGDHHDGMYYFGLAASANTPDPTSNTRGLLCINHENITESYLHPNGVTITAGVRPETEAIKEIECHGVSVIEVTRAGANGAWSYAQASALNRRITPLTPMDINGPVRGHPLVQTVFSADGTRGRGTINNCANGFTPWSTYLTCEENWAGYFRRRSTTDNPLRTAKEITALTRYSVGGGPLGGGANSWFSVVPANASDTSYARWTAEVSGAAAVNDFRNEANQFGWVVEIDPFDPASTPRKRTALGRMAHEGAWPGRFVVGTRPAWYMGDDATGDYCYKFVSSQPWVAADATAANRLATGDKYLDTGTLYVARFDADGTGVWLPLVFGQGNLTAANPAYAFADQADVLTHARLAGDALGATRMDRPEWTAVNPANGEMYLTLTNAATARGNTLVLDAANPRAYVDTLSPSSSRGNRNGHIIRLRETGNTTEALAFTWDIYTFGANSALDANNINVSGLSADNDHSSPDGLWFSRSQNAGGVGLPLLWVQTDDGNFTYATNNQMLVGQPGVVGDGGTRTITSTIANGSQVSITTRVGALPGTTLRRFLVGPDGCEITGIDSTPDGRTVFVNIQHPGETSSPTPPNPLPSNWPASQGGVVAPTSRPRSATIVITKDDGGVVGA
ncbi:MAG: alkaline phosphatase PhoX [Sphingomonadaceae bacterium]